MERVGAWSESRVTRSSGNGLNRPGLTTSLKARKADGLSGLSSLGVKRAAELK